MPATVAAATLPPHPYPPDVQVIHLDGREIFLVGTAHISQQSVDLVRQVIAAETPDCVCVELDEKRYESLSQRKRWVTLNLREIIYKKQLATLLVNLILASYQKKLGEQLGVLPGTELLEAVRAAEEQGVAVALCDRDVRVTLRRAWQATGFWKKGYLMVTLLASLFETTELTEEKLAELRTTDVLSELMDELGGAMPELKRVLIDERDTFLSEKIKAAAGKRLVAVVGAGHVTGIKTALTEDRSDRMAEISIIPPVSPVWKIVGWAIPSCIILAIVVAAFDKGRALAGEFIIFWALAHSIPAALGALLALAHPATILAAFLFAPFTSLTPVLRTGHVTAFVQTMKAPPLVSEFETVLADILTLRGWWRNRLLKVFMAFLLPAIGSTIGSVVAGYRIFSNLL